MPSADELKRLVFGEIDSRADEIINISKTILGHPEPGFRETRTSQLVADKFAELGLPFRAGLAMTGVRADLLGGSPGPTMALLGELDSLIVSEHLNHRFQRGNTLFDEIRQGFVAANFVENNSNRIDDFGLFGIPHRGAGLFERLAKKLQITVREFEGKL